jgi:hypothetical protein
MQAINLSENKTYNSKRGVTKKVVKFSSKLLFEKCLIELFSNYNGS